MVESRVMSMLFGREQMRIGSGLRFKLVRDSIIGISPTELFPRWMQGLTDLYQEELI